MVNDLNLRVDGIYDKRTLQTLKELTIGSFCFDLRPLSLNFLQQHILMDILQVGIQSKERFYLHYEGEPDFVTQKMLDDLTESLSDEVIYEHFVLEFSDSRPVSFYDNFGIPFFWHYQPDGHFKKVLKAKNLHGIVINFHTLEKFYEEGSFYNFVNNFHQLLHDCGKSNLELVLKMDWDSNVMESLFEYFDFNTIAIPINKHIETSYRQVNLRKMKDHLSFLQENGHTLFKVDINA